MPVPLFFCLRRLDSDNPTLNARLLEEWPSAHPKMSDRWVFILLSVPLLFLLWGRWSTRGWFPCLPSHSYFFSYIFSTLTHCPSHPVSLLAWNTAVYLESKHKHLCLPLLPPHFTVSGWSAFPAQPAVPVAHGSHGCLLWRSSHPGTWVPILLMWPPCAASSLLGSLLWPVCLITACHAPSLHFYYLMLNL